MSRFVIWERSIKTTANFEVEEALLPRQRKISKRIDTCKNENWRFQTSKDYLRKSYLEVFDQLIESPKSRLETDSAKLSEYLEKFAIGQTADVDAIVNFCKDDFDKARLLSKRDMFIQILKRKIDKPIV